MPSRRSFLAAVAAGSLLTAPPLTAQTSRAGVAGESAGTWLLVDDHHVLYRAGTRRRFHPLLRYRGNPVLKGAERPWEVAVAYCSVHFDAGRGLWQMWYQAFAGDAARERANRCTVCYAESRDGIAWTKPGFRASKTTRPDYGAVASR